MGELYNPFPKLPKNIRQIGDTDQVVRLYVEDYVNTYLKRLYPAGNQTLRVGLLLGSTENYDGTPYIFIDGAIEMEDVEVSGEKIEFSENAWKKAYRGIEESFPKRTVRWCTERHCARAIPRRSCICASQSGYSVSALQAPVTASRTCGTCFSLTASGTTWT